MPARRAPAVGRRVRRTQPRESRTFARASRHDIGARMPRLGTSRSRDGDRSADARASGPRCTPTAQRTARLGHERRDSDFRSAYRHGFLRVAAATLRTVIGDPAANAAAVLATARECARRGRRARRLPRADAHRLLDRGPAAAGHPARRRRGRARRGRRGLGGPAAGARRRPARCAAATGSTTSRAVVHRGRLLGVAPKSYLPTYREFYERRQVGARRRPARHDRAWPAPRCRSGRTCCSPPRTCPGFVLHVEVCEDMWVPVPPSATAALAGATVLANLSGSPITVGRAEARSLLARSASARCLAAYVYAAAGEGESTTDLAWDGQTMIWENGMLLGRDRALPEGRAALASPTSTSTCCAPSGCGWAPSTTTAAPSPTRTDGVPDRRVPARPARRRPRAAPRAGAVPVRARRPARLEQDCYEAYNIQVAGPGAAAARRSGNPKVVIGVSGGLDSTHALIVAAKAMDREGRPRSDILGVHAAGLRHRRRAPRATRCG